ncbi:MAG: hypothetical protein OHK0039_12770 [Bacteroidia bacterium]
MPFKLKDSGLTLLYAGTDTTQAGMSADVLALRFSDVGDTPQNGYRVWVDQEQHLVRQWAYYREASDTLPAFINPWDDYQPYGDILLSSNRGARALTEIAVFDRLPDSLFENP